MQKEEKIIGARELAKRLGVSYATVLSWVRRGVIPCLRASQRPVLFDFQEVKDALSRKAKLHGETAEKGGRLP